ncbi:BTB/POZ domain containing protein [Lasiodiplodia theobromae]|uniref:BTB/POZ domain containing protein n=1 Tax=Lasiodiplodia theobromae TaxID=45133 RepID=UPI0015C391AD|nr:BTB/POZ domain containing protein [Lasiodiplodia theobromae]KAF4541479.1 BTB/POZ domain containing protein [Lasiodiplodia theobromae]
MEPSKLREREDTALKDAHGKILHSGAYSDMKIRLSDETEIACHRAIVCERCDFFKNALQSGFKETHSGVIEMFDDPPEAVRALVSYLYTADYPDNGLIDQDLVLFHMGVYTIAATYLVEGLANVAKDHVWDWYSQGPGALLDLANALGECKLKFGKLYETHKFYDELVETVVKEHYDLEYFFNMEDMLVECPDFAYDVEKKAWKLWKTRNNNSSARYLKLYGDLGGYIQVRSTECPRRAEWFAEGEVIIDCEEDTESNSGSEGDTKSDGDGGEDTVDG